MWSRDPAASQSTDQMRTHQVETPKTNRQLTVRLVIPLMRHVSSAVLPKATVVLGDPSALMDGASTVASTAAAASVVACVIAESPSD